jgi:hypothetical protein
MNLTSLDSVFQPELFDTLHAYFRLWPPMADHDQLPTGMADHHQYTRYQLSSSFWVERYPTWQLSNLTTNRQPWPTPDGDGWSSPPYKIPTLLIILNRTISHLPTFESDHQWPTMTNSRRKFNLCHYQRYHIQNCHQSLPLKWLDTDNMSSLDLYA